MIGFFRAGEAEPWSLLKAIKDEEGRKETAEESEKKGVETVRKLRRESVARGQGWKGNRRPGGPAGRRAQSPGRPGCGRVGSGGLRCAGGGAGWVAGRGAPGGAGGFPLRGPRGRGAVWVRPAPPFPGGVGGALLYTTAENARGPRLLPAADRTGGPKPACRPSPARPFSCGMDKTRDSRFSL